MKKLAWIGLALMVLAAPLEFSRLAQGNADTPACCASKSACCPTQACCKGGSHSMGAHCPMAS
ncbi:MAG TPA: hypothetical protein VMA09_07215 [Candidatus Binataceae bacterium]|nr:hypothetical protein [Candidatus Binataceae bacterium]